MIGINEPLWTKALLPWLVIVYFWMDVATPFNSSIFGFFEVIHFERIIIFLMVVAAIATSRVRSIASPVAVLFLLLSFWMLISWLASSYKQYPQVHWWATEYWKQLAAFLVFASSIRDRREVAFILLGFAGVCALYQTHSWFDFARGGSYVYQQGIRRMVGVWSGGGLGSANSYASMAAASIPLGYYTFRVAWSRWVRFAGVYLIIISVASIIFSGTRGALLTAIVVTMVLVLKNLKLSRTILVLGVLTVAAWIVVPDDLVSRYTNVSFGEDKSGMSRAEGIAASSAQGRIDGLIDGFRMANDRPILGQGPGASAWARMGYRDMEVMLQLHSQIGQVLGELGYPGLLIWISLLMVALKRTYSMAYSPKLVGESQKTYAAASQCLFYLILTMTVYGAVSHNLYKEVWIFYFSLTVVMDRGQRSESLTRELPMADSATNKWQ